MVYCERKPGTIAGLSVEKADQFSIAGSAKGGIQLQKTDGSMPLYHNGPRHDAETSVCHRLL